MHVFFIQKLDIISKEANATFWLKNRVLPSRPTVAMPKLARWRAQPKMEDQRKPDPEIQGIYYGLQ